MSLDLDCGGRIRSDIHSVHNPVDPDIVRFEATPTVNFFRQRLQFVHALHQEEARHGSVPFRRPTNLQGTCSHGVCCVKQLFILHQNKVMVLNCEGLFAEL